MKRPVDLADIERAAVRIRGKVRQTPVMRPGPLLEQQRPDAADLTLKLECLQVTGSFKPRGATNKALQLGSDELQRGVCTASGGNHGLAVAYVGHTLGTPARIYVPRSTPGGKVRKIEAWQAEVIVEGEIWDEANTAAQEYAARNGMAYLHPFADPAVIAGQGTLGLEILSQVPQLDTVLVAIGGGGLIAGVATAIHTLRPEVRIVGVEPVGAPTLRESVAAGHLVTLDAINTQAGTLAPQRSAPINLDIIRRDVDQIVLVTDDDMRQAAQWLWFEMGVAAELSGAATLAALFNGAYRSEPGERILALVCGAGTDGL